MVLDCCDPMCLKEVNINPLWCKPATFQPTDIIPRFKSQQWEKVIKYTSKQDNISKIHKQ